MTSLVVDPKTKTCPRDFCQSTHTYKPLGNPIAASWSARNLTFRSCRSWIGRAPNCFSRISNPRGEFRVNVNKRCSQNDFFRLTNNKQQTSWAALGKHKVNKPPAATKTWTPQRRDNDLHEDHTCRVQNPDIPRAGRCGAARGGAGRGRAGTGSAGRRRDSSPRGKQPLSPPRRWKNVPLGVCLEARAKETLCKPTGEHNERLTTG